MEVEKLETTKSEIEGMWVPFRDAKLLICSATKPAYRRALQARMKPFQRQLRRELMPQEELDKITVECFAEHVLIGWSGFTEKGAELPYSKAKAVELLTKYPKLYDAAAGYASDAAAFEEQVLEEGIENAKNG